MKRFFAYLLPFIILFASVWTPYRTFFHNNAKAEQVVIHTGSIDGTIAHESVSEDISIGIIEIKEDTQEKFAHFLLLFARIIEYTSVQELLFFPLYKDTRVAQALFLTFRVFRI